MKNQSETYKQLINFCDLYNLFDVFIFYKPEGKTFPCGNKGRLVLTQSVMDFLNVKTSSISIYKMYNISLNTMRSQFGAIQFY